MIFLLHSCILIPIAGFVISIFIPGRKESIMSSVAFVTSALNLAAASGLIVLWLIHQQPTLSIKEAVIFHSESYTFFIDFSFDKIAAVYLFTGALLTLMVITYSRVYLHRESGYKRFFNTILFFYIGYNTVVLSGNFETLFTGWEVLGISSFLLIAFYRDRYLPVKNAVKVFSIYRVGDVGLILAMWMSHHLWHENITFSKLANYGLVHTQLQTHTLIGVFISLMILVSAAVKSAQFPFSSWLPRAMEGPTPSSAIFYGSLSVHLGVFLLLRTFPFWEHQLSVRILIGAGGLLTSLTASGVVRVQSSIKSQIAYASIAQIGIMFIEVAAGFENLALIHFAGNAFLRTYQLLVSPSVVTYLIREQFYHFQPREYSLEDSFPKRLEYTLYMLCLKEWNLDSFMYHYLWNPLKRVGKRLEFFTVKRVILIFTPLYLAGLFLTYHKAMVPGNIQQVFTISFAVIALVMVLKSFAERKDAYLSWTLVNMSHFWVALAVSFNEQFRFDHIHLYLSGVATCGILGFLCLYRLQTIEHKIDLDQFHGHSQKHQGIAFVFLLACLGVAGFPITPTFIGEDLIFTHVHEDQALLAFVIALSFIIDGLALIRIYARLFLGPHVKSVYDIAYRSS